MGLIGPVGTNLGSNAAFRTSVIYRSDRRLSASRPRSRLQRDHADRRFEDPHRWWPLEQHLTGKTGTAIWSVGEVPLFRRCGTLRDARPGQWRVVWDSRSTRWQ